ncbi:hypothetical protein V6R21_13145 [Limibacter armeniacum]|uniref:hypothetical protein n=1 Tax=Limibacter armeniacum TaxID=466084 RepID=UPI002FE64A09
MKNNLHYQMLLNNLKSLAKPSTLVLGLMAAFYLGTLKSNDIELLTELLKNEKTKLEAENAGQQDMIKSQEFKIRSLEKEITRLETLLKTPPQAFSEFQQTQDHVNELLELHKQAVIMNDSREQFVTAISQNNHYNRQIIQELRSLNKLTIQFQDDMELLKAKINHQDKVLQATQKDIEHIKNQNHYLSPKPNSDLNFPDFKTDVLEGKMPDTTISWLWYPKLFKLISTFSIAITCILCIIAFTFIYLNRSNTFFHKKSQDPYS